MTTDPRPSERLTARRALAALFAVLGTLVWTHALAGVVRAAAGIPVPDLAPAAPGLTLAAICAALLGALGGTSARRAGTLGALAATAGALALGSLHPALRLPVLALVPATLAFSVLGAWLARRLPESIEHALAGRPARALALGAVAVLAVVQVGRLSTYMTDAEADWFLSTRHPFYAKHECANAYVYGAELHRRGEANVYDAAHYPGLNPEAAADTEMVGMAPEDPYQYPPPFLLVPRLAIGITSDYGAIRSLWFGLNVTLCMGAVLALASWVGGRGGMLAGLLAPAMLVAFPVLHDFQYGQAHFAAVALAILGLVAFQRGRSPLGGLLLASAILAKVFPALLIVPLAVQRRWRDLAWTAGAGAGLSALALALLGPAPFAAFFGYHLPRLASGEAFAFGEAWPDVADLVTAGNQGVQGIVHKLAAMGVPGAGAALAGVVGKLYALALLGLAALAGVRLRDASRVQHAVTWLGLIGLGSLASTGAWADYVPLTCVWLLAYLAPLTVGRPLARAALALCALMQFTLLGTMPVGQAADPSWMVPLSLLGALTMLATFAGGVLARPAPAPQASPAAAAPRLVPAAGADA